MAVTCSSSVLEERTSSLPCSPSPAPITTERLPLRLRAGPRGAEQGFPWSLAVDATSVYWGNFGSGVIGAGSLMKLTPK